MKEIAFIDGKIAVEIKDYQLATYLDSIEAAGYVVKANKCKGKGGLIDILMIGRAADFEEFFSGKARVKEVYKQSPRIYRLLFNDNEIILYLLAQDYEIV